MKSHRVFLKGIGKTGGWFALSRGIQLAAAVWVTRQLDPADFAIIAAIFAIQGFANRATGLNFAAELVRAKEVTSEDLRVAWTYGLLRNLLLFGVVASLAPVFAGWMGKPEAALPLRVLSLGFVVSGLLNPRLVELRREGRFGLFACIESVPIAAYGGFCVFFIHFEASYWALVWANLASVVVGLVLSYSVRPWRPGLSLNWEVGRPLISFGLILLVTSIFGALREHGSVFLLSALGHADDLGFYNRGVAFSWGLCLSAISVYWKVAYPLFSQAELQGENCFRLAGQQQRVLLLVGLPVALLLSQFGDTLIPWVLGPQWIPIIPLWSWMTVASAITLANAPFQAAFQAARHERRGLWIYCITTMLQLGLAAFMIPLFGLTAAGIAATISVACSLILLRIFAISLTRKKEGTRDRSASLPVG